MKSVMMNEHPSMLYVDDDPLTHRMIKLYLNAKNVNIDFAFDGKMAFHHIQHKKYDLIISDIQMPEMDGVEAAKLIKKEISPKNKPMIIAMTAHALKGDRDKYIQLGMDGYISKPVKSEELIHTLKSIGSTIR
jgi:polar amino acid transport system substrate-binding protein